ncbi:MAG: YcaQ family DNA glycosylase [Gemmatimonadetes bacterium]|nr:YcaQ family DNA glycosylase [Gemmatimonadota bacterium]
MNTIDVRSARRLALARAGLLKPEWSGLPARARGRGKRARAACHAVLDRFGYLQLDTVSIAGARSHAIVLLSRIEGLDPDLPERLLVPGAPVFEYWGHEASWLPLDLYPDFGWRRQAFRKHPWWGDIVGKHPDVARKLLKRIRDDGPIRSADMEGPGSRGWWDLKLTKKVATALWSSGELAIRERRNFQRSYDLAERVIPQALREPKVRYEHALEKLLLKGLDGHGWATTGTLSRTWRLTGHQAAIGAALERLERRGDVTRAALRTDDGKRTAGWIRPSDLELAERLRVIRPRADTGVLLSPFDPVLWERKRVQDFFAFDQVLEIFKPEGQRKYGYYCLPVLAGERLVARVDLKAHRKEGRLRVLSRRFEGNGDGRRPARTADAEATRVALERYAAALGLELDPS